MIRIGHAADNMSTLRRLALNPVKGEKSLKIGVAAKRKRAGWVLEYLRTILRLGARWRRRDLTRRREGAEGAKGGMARAHPSLLPIKGLYCAPGSAGVPPATPR